MTAGSTKPCATVPLPARDSAVPWIETIDPDDATGLLKEAYDWQAERLGEPTEFTMLGSLYPEIVMERLRLYRAVEGCPSKLAPSERQLAAYVASMLNGTGHCASGLRVKLPTLGVDDATIGAVTRDAAHVATGDERLDTILRYAARLSQQPIAVTAGDLDALREVGLDDLDILDLNNIVAYYCYINRVANGLGLLTEIPAEHALSALPK
jgi:uncharacterized peroxidase-related enzyme